MSILERARRDMQRITSDKSGGFAVEITFTSPDGSTATINGLHTKHHTAIDTEGRPVNSKNAHISFSETLLNEQGYITRPPDYNGEVNLKSHRVAVKDSTGTVKNYKIRQWFPDETLGLIVCILDDYSG